ncbi:MAG: hypothetical protein LQ341_002902 [Variospora aurantia]|nr:MAG: hypothetical protein LQ341_002902 [Variospora aurantia]
MGALSIKPDQTRPDEIKNRRLNIIHAIAMQQCSTGDSVSTRGQNLPSLIQSRSSASLRDVRTYLNQRKTSVYHDETDEEPDVERDGGLRSSQRNGPSPASNKIGRPERRASNTSEPLMTPQMRSMRLIGNSNPRYQWEKYYKSDEELKQMKKPMAKVGNTTKGTTI